MAIAAVSLLLSVGFIGLPSRGSAQGPAPAPAAPASPTAVSTATPSPAPVKTTPPPELTSGDLATFLDGLIPEQLLRNDTAGATVSVVKDGQVLLCKGYGFADAKARAPVSGDETLFRPGSITKLFTATAVMQLVEAGRLDLDRNVNGYLDFAIPDTFSEPITLRRLLTHTAGFEETAANLFADGPAQMLSLRDYILRSQPRRIFAPGAVSSYSNYGMSLAGYIVERVSGEPFAAYVGAHVLAPLRMAHSTFEQPLPPTLDPLMSKGYASAGVEPASFEMIPASPAGALSATAADMARFMLAYLQDGSLDGAQILRPETVREMWRRQFEPHPKLNAMGLAFYEESDASGPEVIGHGGDTNVFHSELFLLPAARVGVFISYNSAGQHAGRARTELRRAFLDRYFPTAPPKPVAPAPDQTRRDAQAVAGQYQTTRRSESTFLKLATLLQQSTVSAKDDGSLTVSELNDLQGHEIRWRPVGSLVYQEENGHGLIAFKRDPQAGQANTLIFNWPGQEAQRVAWFENQNVALPVIGAALSVLLATSILWPAVAVSRRYYGRPLAPTPVSRAVRVLFVLGRLACLLDVLVIVGWLVLFSMVDSQVSVLGDLHTGPIRLLEGLGWVGVVGTLVVLAAALALTRQGKSIRLWPKIHQWILVPACLVVDWLEWHWHLLG